MDERTRRTDNVRVLITGAAGRIGSVLVKGLKDRYRVRGFDRVEMPDLEDSLVGDVADFDAVLKATEGMEAVIHLAAVPSGAEGLRTGWHPREYGDPRKTGGDRRGTGCIYAVGALKAVKFIVYKEE